MWLYILEYCLKSIDKSLRYFRKEIKEGHISLNSTKW